MEETKKTQVLTLVKLNTKYKMIIPSFVEQKIRYICSKIWDREWSGTLFYKAEGSFEDGSLVITCADIFVMDIGNTTYTEFDMSPEVVTYMAQHPELMECQTGLIHSHHSMASFFSGTDTNTLEEEGKDRNHFVSLIVNNAGSYTAAITRKIKSKRTISDTFSYESFEGTPIESTDSKEKEIEEIQYFYLNIIKENNNSLMPEIDSRLEEIKKAKTVKEIKYNQDTLFSDNNYIRDHSKYLRVTQSPEPIVNQYFSDFDTIPLESESITNLDNELKADPKLIHSLCIQLLTGSVMLSDSSKINIEKWIKGMNSIVEKRFGTGSEGIEYYKEFIGSFVEFLVWNTKDPTLNDIDNDCLMTIIASDMLEYLSTLPQNIYTKICQEALAVYI